MKGFSGEELSLELASISAISPVSISDSVIYSVTTNPGSGVSQELVVESGTERAAVEEVWDTTKSLSHSGLELRNKFE